MQIPPVPINSPVLQHADSDPQEKQPFRAKLHREMVRFLNLLRDRLGLSTSVIGSVSVEGGSAAVPTTDIPTPSLTAGVYRVTYGLRISRAATTSSSCGVTLGWTAGGVSCAILFTLLTGNTTASATSDTITMAVDAATPITYAVSYSSVGGVSMTYALAIEIESFP